MIERLLERATSFILQLDMYVCVCVVMRGEKKCHYYLQYSTVSYDISPIQPLKQVRYTCSSCFCYMTCNLTLLIYGIACIVQYGALHSTKQPLHLVIGLTSAGGLDGLDVMGVMGVSGVLGCVDVLAGLDGARPSFHPSIIVSLLSLSPLMLLASHA